MYFPKRACSWSCFICEGNWFTTAMVFFQWRFCSLVCWGEIDVCITGFFPLRIGRYIPPHLRNKDASKNGEFNLALSSTATVIPLMFEIH